jgi:hypothetical protein
MFKKFGLLVAGVFAATLATVANAAPGAALAVADVTGTIDNQLPSITSVGMSILAVVALIACIAWVRRPIH